MAYTIAFFGTKPYDESSFNKKNKEFGFEIRYYKGNLNKNNLCIYNQLLLNNLQVISQKYGRNL